MYFIYIQINKILWIIFKKWKLITHIIAHCLHVIVHRSPQGATLEEIMDASNTCLHTKMWSAKDKRHGLHSKRCLLTWDRTSLPWARSHLHLDGPCPSHASFIAQSSCPHLHGNSSLLGMNVTIPDHLRHWAPLAYIGTP